MCKIRVNCMFCVESLLKSRCLMTENLAVLNAVLSETGFTIACFFVWKREENVSYYFSSLPFFIRGIWRLII